MNKTTYEYHNFPQNTLPVILRHVIITDKSTDWVNWHDNIELLLITSGSGYIISNGIKYSVQKDDIFVVNSNMLHYMQTDSVLKYYCIIIDSNYLLNNGINVSSLKYQSVIQSNDAKVKYKELIKELKSDHLFQVSGALSALLGLMTYISRFYSCKTDDSLHNSSTVDTKIKMAIKYIQTHINRPITIDELASHTYMSKDYFSHVFKSSIGTSPITYINKLRCFNAQNLLQRGNDTLSIHEVAVQCGFENDSYFSRTFKKYIGVLPSEYAKKYHDRL